MKPAILFLAVIGVLVFLFLFKGPLDWDALVYIMNAKQMTTGYVYHEDFRPPLLPIIYSIFFGLSTSELIPRIISLLFSTSAVTAVFILARELYGNKIAMYSTVFFTFSAAFLIWSAGAYTEIPSLALTLFAALAYLQVKNKYYVASGVLLTMATLMKYTAAYAIFSLLLCEIWVGKRNMKGYLLFLLAFVATLSPYFYYNWQVYHQPFYSMMENFRLAEGSPNTYYADLNTITALNLLVIVYAGMHLFRKLQKPDKLMIALFAPILIFFTFFSHHDARYFLLSYPLLTTFASAFLAKHCKKVFYVLVISSLVMFVYALFSIDAANRYNVSIKEVSLSLTNLNGTFYSDFWPYIAYYAEKDVGAFPWPPERLLESINARRVQYFVALNYPGEEPCYIRPDTLAQLPFIRKVTLNDTVYSRIDVKVYEVNRAKLDPSDTSKYISILRC